jgi:hypothetical protein
MQPGNQAIHAGRHLATASQSCVSPEGPAHQKDFEAM